MRVRLGPGARRALMHALVGNDPARGVQVGAGHDAIRVSRITRALPVPHARAPAGYPQVAALARPVRVAEVKARGTARRCPRNARLRARRAGARRRSCRPQGSGGGQGSTMARARRRVRRFGARHGAEDPWPRTEPQFVTYHPIVIRDQSRTARTPRRILRLHSAPTLSDRRASALGMALSQSRYTTGTTIRRLTRLRPVARLLLIRIEEDEGRHAARQLPGGVRGGGSFEDLRDLKARHPRGLVIAPTRSTRSDGDRGDPTGMPT